MNHLACSHCGQLLQLEAELCTGCASRVGFDPDGDRFLRLDQASGIWSAGTEAVAATDCANRRHGVCNWVVTDGHGSGMCRACRHNRMIPDLSIPGMLDRWRRIEEAKRRVILGMIRLGLPPLLRTEGPDGLAFDFLYDPAAEQGFAAFHPTGHQAGVVTLNVVEADAAARERTRSELGEPYRTLVGHFRHEIAHYYWYRLVERTPDLEPFRAMFGDERADYAQATRDYYANPPAGWEDHFVSAYATSHPWEDFAESFAHYLHIVDTLAVARSFDMRLSKVPASGRPGPHVDFNPYAADTAAIVDQWIPFAFAMNAINRSMGQPDLYPFTLTSAVVLKLDFVNRLIAYAAGRWAAGDAEGAPLKAIIATLGHGVEQGG